MSLTGTVYTGGSDGRLFAIRNRTLKLIGRTGITHPLCGSFELEPACGRPKGMKVGPDGNLYIVDAYKGLLKMNLKNSTLETLIESEKGIRNTSIQKICFHYNIFRIILIIRTPVSHWVKR